MHIKIAFTVCVVYFLTSTWSMGLNSVQLKQFKKYFENHKKCTGGVSEEEIEQVVKESFGIEWKQSDIYFGYSSDEPDSMNLFYLLGALAEKDNKIPDNIISETCVKEIGIKSSDNIIIDKGEILTPFEVYFYLDEFIACAMSHRQPGYLTLQQLSKVFKYWTTINSRLNAKSKELEIEKGVRYVINTADFLLIMLEIKPEGRGLTLAQLKMFVALYEKHKTSKQVFQDLGRKMEFGCCKKQKTTGLAITIDPDESEKVFNELGITIDDELELLFKSELPAGKLLMYLIIVAAERNTAVEDNELIVLSPSEVVFAIKEFNKMKIDNDGLVSPYGFASFKAESSIILESKCSKEARQYFWKLDGINTLNVAEYMEILSFVEKHVESEPEDVIFEFRSDDDMYGSFENDHFMTYGNGTDSDNDCDFTIENDEAKAFWKLW
ncbi:uncharacterized protein LOC126847724 [Adelges cooleyi]|uniref:uncharacterized protein LOC126847724 n=1 Tax=Adelges cooleyi TaxID=133065 RepID=UPI0021808843|nr:uncharacterized protein LOC126847724 [Adelges cooleyi]